MQSVRIVLCWAMTPCNQTRGYQSSGLNM